MALIEGVGDEVTLLFALVLILSVVALAWISTHTTERNNPHWSSRPSHVPEEEEGGAPSASHDPLSGPEDGPSPSEGPQEPPLESDPTNREPPENDPPTLRNRGPGAPSESTDRISLRLKFLNDTERVVPVCPSDTVLYIKRTHFPGQEGHVRLIYQGQLLRDDSRTVASLQLTDGCVVHCHISQHAASPGQSSGDLPVVPLNIGTFLVPLLVFILALLWYCQFQYPDIFTATATVCLGAITLLVIVITFATSRG
ncbi:transmembrane and ubiquitin-like domain-containing protein 1 [Rana temporaria]|uniref:transmembrane and ubiquitin-like domain-containing protein 1 n=1 Tax=Rana temporaria TaxID=8407 RepID=UPI001AADAE8C|nr:transmembrane and ubiquitin-like domain-containing protein 1 [Rana temporaria]